MDRYIDLIEQTFYFPTEEFKVVDNDLHFNEVPLMDIVNKYGTPLKLTFLPKISSQIQKAKKFFNEAIANNNYQGNYVYCYCTKSSHFQFVLEEALRNDIHIETSSAYDIPIVKILHKKGKISKDTFVICNGYKRPEYTQYISDLINEGFKNCIPILDNLDEINAYDEQVTNPCFVGMRLAADEEPKFEFYTSRLGIRYNDVLPLYESKIKDNPKFKLKMLHFFINTGMKDTTYYWSELSRFVHKYCELRKVCPDLDSIDIGGGWPIKTSVHFDYDYGYMADQIVKTIKRICTENQVPVPNIFTEFGSFTVGESGAVLYSVLGSKLQNDKEEWYMIDSSFITTLPDVWGLNQKFILLAVNNWNKEYDKVKIGGITCDSMDYYNSEAHLNMVFLPKLQEQNKQIIGFFHTGAYQESLGGYGGIQHCLVPAPKHVLIQKDENGNFTDTLFAPEQDKNVMLKILGYES
ncbi:decarboxylase [Sporocytophaga myxococcoides]|uniref:decarboxylase n=1 Tax=Sporocytophaga myxococcoides TaxID=153721 RepID=UPI0003F62992|nr:decarboxylase [Sporocytophaga myxococcoides]